MLDNSEEFIGLVYTVTEIAKADNVDDILELLLNSQITISQTAYDNWNGGTYGYTIYFEVDVKTFIGIKDKLEKVETSLLERFGVATRHLDNENVSRVSIVPKSYVIGTPSPDPHRPFTSVESKRREELTRYLNSTSEDELIAEVLVPLFRQLGFHRITSAGHKDKALEYGKDIWMKYTLPTQHILYFGIQVKKGKLDAAGVSKNTNVNVAEIHHQALMMLGHEIFDPEVSRTVLVDHAFIVAGGEITKAARNWIGQKFDNVKRSQIMFMDRNDILNLFVVTNLPLPSAALSKIKPIDDLPF
jgi:hypothetical protein